MKATAFFAQADTFTRTPISSEYVSLLAYFESSYFMGRSELRLRIVDIV